MLQAAIDIPQPLSADTETVITALETAALFGSKGDAHEAMRWLRRAAESAGEAGDDLRALALSRSAADLNEELSAKRSLTEPSSPPQPSLAPPPAAASPPSAQLSAPPTLPPSVQPPRPSAAPPSVRASYPVPPSSRPRFRTSTPTAGLPAQAAPDSGSRPHATRVAIHRSASAPGTFEVRVLADGEAAQPGDSEAFLVMIDPQSTLLSS